ncbi:MAG: hypothetical protein JWL77_2254 [Chthonomonadaceae bacterium]|nr:hypothetical protein [Chthonomonadaceae bacterium]
MKQTHDRAFKEWAVSCQALVEGRQILLIRKGGIREEGGVFRINDPEFWLMPTYEHQNGALLQPEWLPALEAIQAEPRRPSEVTLSAYAVVDTIAIARDDAQVNALAHEHIWNPAYVKMRFDFNPYDPLYLVLLRVYRLPEPITIPMLGDYEGCKSWVTLDRSLATDSAIPVLDDTEFAARHAALLDSL